MSIKNTYKGWKTTLLGLLFLAVAVAYLWLNEMPDATITVFLFTMGGIGIIAPDKLLDKIRK
jgi:hypothetical protein